jgi:VWFA-related protein
MRMFSILLLLTAITPPAFSAKRVSVDQLEQVLAAAHGKSDAKVSQQLSELELTERLSAARLARGEKELSGAESKRSLVVLADLSAFLDLPASEIPATAAPDLAAQRHIMAEAIGYAERTISKLPNFFATRDTIFFEDVPLSSRADTSVIPYQPLHPVGRSSDTVLYRDGREVVDWGATKHKKNDAGSQGLITSGVFGPILGTVLVDAAQGKLVWSHWEQSTAGPQAVFRFAIPREKSHYQVEYCCVPGFQGNGVFQQFSGYHGEIAVDPEDGAILRLTLEADLKPTDPLLRSDILVEYGPVEIGGKKYICPVKSVSITLAPAPAAGMQRYRGELLNQESWAAREHLQTLLNDVVFAQYHLFRSESRILTENGAESHGDPSSSGPANAKNAELAATPESPAEAVPVLGGASVAPANSATEIAPALPLVPEPATPEMNVAESVALPEPDSTPHLTPEAGFTLRVTTRLVDLGVVVFDKKGHPLTDLKPQDFEIFDNGRKQELRFLSQPGSVNGGDSAKALSGPQQAPSQLIFTNRPAHTTGAMPGTEATEGSVTILLIDAGNLAWADLTYARGEMMRFLRSLPAGERVGLYVEKAHGFQVIEEETTDHALLASKLSAWMPSAQDLARSQEAEQHNRQQFDYVLNPTDLQTVNGNVSSAPETATMIDPQLRDFGANPARGALALMAGVARHLAAIPGHKNLVWVTSDNVLADWADKAVTSEKSSKRIDGVVLRAQEALNDAHVSVYPFDASQLETMATDPSLKTRNIELAPSAADLGPQPQSGGPGAGRITAEMQQDIHPIQAPIQEMAEATGGRVFRRSGDIAANLNTVVSDGRAAYLLGFTPDKPADDQYHLLAVKIAGRRGVTLRYRTGYQYSKEPATLKERFQKAIWQSIDVSEIAVSAKAVSTSTGTALKLNIEANDVELRQQGDRWMDRLDVFLIQRDEEGLHAQVTGQTLSLKLKPATYAKLVQEGIPFDEALKGKQNSGAVRVIVVDENSGRMGSVTVPASVLQGKG